MCRFVACIGLIVVAQLAAQAPRPRFDVATMKVCPPTLGGGLKINIGTFLRGRLTLNNATLADAIKYAWSLASDEQLVTPDRSGAVRFDIEALAPPETPRAQVGLMLQCLLEERLHW